jgi:preprotein translocase subunit YajC
MNGASLLLILVAFAFLYLVLIRPQRRRQMQSRQLLDNLAIGDEVVTAGGIYGRVTELLDGDVLIEIAPSTTVRLARRAIGAIVPPAVEAEEEEPPAVENGG